MLTVGLMAFARSVWTDSRLIPMTKPLAYKQTPHVQAPNVLNAYPLASAVSVLKDSDMTPMISYLVSHALYIVYLANLMEDVTIVLTFFTYQLLPTLAYLVILIVFSVTLSMVSVYHVILVFI